MTGNYAYTPSIWPSFCTFLLLIVLAVYSGRRRNVPGALPFAIGSLFGALWVAVSIMEAAAVDMETKIFWFKVQGLLRLVGMLGAVGLTLVALVCVETKHEGPTSQSELAKVLTTGSWTSAATAASSALNPGSCGNLEWKITSLTDTSAWGTFKATCGGGLTLEGSAEGKLNGLTADLKASGTRHRRRDQLHVFHGGYGRARSLDKVRINYSGTTCLGPVSGSELLTKR